MSFVLEFLTEKIERDEWKVGGYFFWRDSGGVGKERFDALKSGDGGRKNSMSSGRAR